MPIPRSHFFPSALLVVLGGAAGAAGCFYNWTVGAVIVETSDSGTLDATVEAAAGDATAQNDGSSGSDAGIDSPVDAAPSNPCPALEAQLNAARAAAKKCDDTTPSQCATTKITDECGCPSFVLSASSSATASFAAEVSAFEEAGCTPFCVDGGCPSYDTIGSCLPSNGSYVCYP